MCRKLSIILLLCVAMLAPSIASAFWAKQKVLVWEVHDRNNDVDLSVGTKAEIKAKLIDAFNKSNNHEAYSDIVSNIKNGLTSQSPIDITKRVHEFYPQVKYVIFTTVKILERSNSYDKYKVLLESDMYSTETLKREKTAAEPMLSDNNQIPAACARLVSKLLGEQQSNQNNSNSYNNYNNNNNYSNSSSYQRPSYQQQSPSYQSQSNYGSSSSSSYSRSTQSTSSQSYTQNAEDRYLNLAREGNTEAQYKLGSCYELGLQGVSKQYQNAFYWYKRAAEQGHTNAQYRLGFCYEYGIGVAKNFDYAVSWYRKAARNGNKAAETRLRQIYKY